MVVRALQAERLAVDTRGTAERDSRWPHVESYDLVILDLTLPGLDGTGLIRRLRRSSTEVPVLVLTASSGVADKIKNF